MRVVSETYRRTALPRYKFRLNYDDLDITNVLPSICGGYVLGSKPTSDSPNYQQSKVFGPRHVIEAVKIVASGEMSIEEASVAYKVSRRTLEKKVNRYKAFQACISNSDETIENDNEKPQSYPVDIKDNHDPYLDENWPTPIDTEVDQTTPGCCSPQVWPDLQKGYYRSYNSEILPRVAMSVAEGQIRLMEACKQYNIPKSTLQARIKQYKMKRSEVGESSGIEHADDSNNDVWNLQEVLPSEDDVVNPSSMIASCNAEQLRQVIRALDEENEENTDTKLNSKENEKSTIQSLLERSSPTDEVKSTRSYKFYNTAIVPSLVENVVQGKMTSNEVVSDYGIPRRTLQAKVKALREQKFRDFLVKETENDLCDDSNIISNNSSIQILSVQSGSDPMVECDETVLQKDYTETQDECNEESLQSDLENDSSNDPNEPESSLCVDVAELRNKQQELMKVPGLTGTEPIKKVMKLVEQGIVTMQQAARHFSIPRFILPKPNADGSPIVLDVSPPKTKPTNKFISSLLAEKIKSEDPGSSSDKWIVPKRPVCRGSYKTYDTKLLPQILDLVMQGHLSQLEAHRQFNIPKSTLQFKLKLMKAKQPSTSTVDDDDDRISIEEPLAPIVTDSSGDDNNETTNKEGELEEMDESEEYMGGDADPLDEDWNPPGASTSQVEYVWDGKPLEEEADEVADEEQDEEQDVQFETLKDSLDDESNVLNFNDDGAGPSNEELSPDASKTFRGNYKHYSAEILMEILQNVDERKITQQQACNYYGIPKSTLQCKLKAYRETGSLQVSPRSRYAPQKRGHYKTYDSSQVPKIAKLVKKGMLKLKQACNLYNIPMSTLQQKIKKLEQLEQLEQLDS